MIGSKGVLVKESPVFDQNGNVTYNQSGQIITKKEFAKDSKGKLVQAKCPFYTNSKYQLFDTYITEIISFGNKEEQTDVNIKNLKFGKLQKIEFNGYSDKINNYTKSLYYLHRSMLGGYMLKNEENSDYKYTLYTKTDPYGTVQRWVSNNIVGPYYQVDDAFYVSGNTSVQNTESVTCTTTTSLTSHYDRLPGNINIETTNDDKIAYDKHFEGSFINIFGNETLFYSDHYVLANQEVGNVNDTEYIERVNNTQGIYYSILKPNKENGLVDFGITNDHIRFNTFTKVNILNDEMKSNKLQGSYLRNGTVYTIKQAISDSNIEKNTIKTILQKAADFNISVKTYKQEDGKIVCVLISNRTINNKDNNGWNYISKIWDDEAVQNNIRDIYSTYYENKKTTPYCSNDTYLYKVFKNEQEFKETSNIDIYDMLDNKKQIIFRVQEEQNNNQQNSSSSSEQQNNNQQNSSSSSEQQNNNQQNSSSSSEQQNNNQENSSSNSEQQSNNQGNSSSGSNQQNENRGNTSSGLVDRGENDNSDKEKEVIKIVPSKIDVIEKTDSKIVDIDNNIENNDNIEEIEKDKTITQDELDNVIREEIEQEDFYKQEESITEIQDHDKKDSNLTIPQTGTIDLIVVIIMIVLLSIIAIVTFILYKRIK